MRDRASGSELVRLLDEAVALERADATWTQKHAAAVAGCSATYLRRSDCPKHYTDGQGPTNKPMLVYVPSEVRAWKAARLKSMADRYQRAS